MTIVLHDKNCSIFGTHPPRKCDCGADETQFIAGPMAPEMLEMPSDVLERVQAALLVAIELAHKVDKEASQLIAAASIDLEEAMQDAMATEA